MERCDELHSSLIQPLNDKTAGPLEKANTGGVSSTKMPFVFVLGNHSSGKSSFINYVLGRSIQTAGVAPTDDRCVGWENRLKRLPEVAAIVFTSWLRCALLFSKQKTQHPHQAFTSSTSSV